MRSFIGNLSTVNHTILRNMENLTDLFRELDLSYNKTYVCGNPDPVTGLCIDLDKMRHDIHAWITPRWYEVIFMILFIAIFVIGLVGNFLVCFVVWRNHRMRTITNTFIFNLAVADFMVLLIALPFTVIQDVFESWFLGEIMCKIVKFVQRVSVVVSVLTLTAIAIERYNAICYPLKARATLMKARLTIVVIWIVAFSASVPEIVFCHIKRTYPEHITPYLVSCRNMKPLFGLYFYFIVFFIIPVAIIAFCYAKIARCLWKSQMPSGNGLSCGHCVNGTGPPQQTRRRTAKMLFVVVLFFFCCYLPVYIINTLLILKVSNMLTWNLGFHQSVVIIMLTHLLLYVNSAMNPVIYNFMSEKFRREFRLTCSFCWRPGKAHNYTTYELTEKRDNVTRTGTTRLLNSADNRGTLV